MATLSTAQWAALEYFATPPAERLRLTIDGTLRAPDVRTIDALFRRDLLVRRFSNDRTDLTVPTVDGFRLVIGRLRRQLGG